jgi:excisionase family DNA binding protein
MAPSLETGGSAVTADELTSALRETIRAIVREELALALADRAEPDELMSTANAAELAGVAEGTVRRWIREGRLPERRAGRLLRVSRSELATLLGISRRAAGELSPEELADRDFG